MVSHNIYRFYAFSLILLAVVSCSPQIPEVSAQKLAPEIEELKNDQDIFLAWSNGINGTGISDDDYGIGGTGISDDDYGIGGTGIVGTISGFGSIIVNGIHIEYSPSQKLESPLFEQTAANLSIGHVVAVEAEKINGELFAKRIIQQIALAGKVEAIDTVNSLIRVEGEEVSILVNENLNNLMLDNIKIGSQVAISGMRDANLLYATNISTQRNQVPSLISGNVTAIKNGQIVIDSRLIFNVTEEFIQNLKVGDFVSINKNYDANDIKSAKYTIKRIYGPMFDGKVNRVSVEGFFNPRKKSSKSNKKVAQNQLERQIIFSVKGSGNQPKIIGIVQLDKKREKKLDFNVPLKTKRSETGKDNSIEIKSLPQKGAKNQQSKIKPTETGQNNSLEIKSLSNKNTQNQQLQSKQNETNKNDQLKVQSSFNGNKKIEQRVKETKGKSARN